jgi:hypothetical protein
LGLHAAPTGATTAAVASARLPVWARPLHGLSFERLCSPGENKNKMQEEAGVQFKRARRKDTKQNKTKMRRNQKECIVLACIWGVSLRGGSESELLLLLLLLLLSLSEHVSSAEKPSQGSTMLPFLHVFELQATASVKDEPDVHLDVRVLRFLSNT